MKNLALSKLTVPPANSATKKLTSPSENLAWSLRAMYQ
jgi:hypothetical protein